MTPVLDAHPRKHLTARCDKRRERKAEVVSGTSAASPLELRPVSWHHWNEISVQFLSWNWNMTTIAVTKKSPDVLIMVPMQFPSFPLPLKTEKSTAHQHGFHIFWQLEGVILPSGTSWKYLHQNHQLFLCVFRKSKKHEGENSETKMWMFDLIWSWKKNSYSHFKGWGAFPHLLGRGPSALSTGVPGAQNQLNSIGGDFPRPRRAN